MSTPVHVFGIQIRYGVPSGRTPLSSSKSQENLEELDVAGSEVVGIGAAPLAG
jgi:hypothetical protein